MPTNTYAPRASKSPGSFAHLFPCVLWFPVGWGQWVISDSESTSVAAARQLAESDIAHHVDKNHYSSKPDSQTNSDCTILLILNSPHSKANGK